LINILFSGYRQDPFRQKHFVTPRLDRSASVLPSMLSSMKNT
jgi:hypothetical protein